MICHVLGIGKEVKGEYQGYSYSNRTVYVSYEDMSRVEAGVVVERFKVPTSVSDLKGIVVVAVFAGTKETPLAEPPTF